MLAACRLCPHRCGVNRLAGATGRCGAGAELLIYRFGRHFGEEPPISGCRGSGTVFFSSCPLRCVYCQNHNWSQSRPLVGRTYSPGDLADIFLHLQNLGCHNVNLVTPEPWIPHIMSAVSMARARGLSIPIVYNTSGFVTEESLKKLANTVDVYLTDLRYSSPEEAREFSGAQEYFDASRRAAMAMLAQVGPLRYQGDGTAARGVIVRHLILPGLSAATDSTLTFIAERLSRAVHVSLLGQFEPVHGAETHATLGRRVSAREYAGALRTLRGLGLTNGWRQRPGTACTELLGVWMPPSDGTEFETPEDC
ncbi:MAG: radical SAM protein [Candidatus Eisenbacteria bacterium]|nr:radical SAM protein [Candidatus Eisenbacteria bacterium]